MLSIFLSFFFFFVGILCWYNAYSMVWTLKGAYTFCCLCRMLWFLTRLIWFLQRALEAFLRNWRRKFITLTPLPVSFVLFGVKLTCPRYWTVGPMMLQLVIHLFVFRLQVYLLSSYRLYLSDITDFFTLSACRSFRSIVGRKPFSIHQRYSW